MDLVIPHLPPQTPIIPFTTKEEATARAEIHANALLDSHLKNQYLIFTNVPQSAMDYWCWSDKGVLKSGRFNYSKASRIMVLKITKPDILNAVLSEWDGAWFFMEGRMGYHDLEGRLAYEYHVSHGYIAQHVFVDMIKQADRYYRTGKAELGFGGGVNVVLEAGLPLGEARLEFDARGWLEAEGSTVSMAVTVVVWEEVERIVVKTWAYVPVSVDVREGSSEEEKGKEEIQCTQQVVIGRRNGKTVSSGPLKFPFKRIFGRDPDPEKPFEKDFILEESDLARVRKRAWRQYFGKDIED